MTPIAAIVAWALVSGNPYPAPLIGGCLPGDQLTSFGVVYPYRTQDQHSYEFRWDDDYHWFRHRFVTPPTDSPHYWYGWCEPGHAAPGGMCARGSVMVLTEVGPYCANLDASDSQHYDGRVEWGRAAVAIISWYGARVAEDVHADR